MGNLHHDQDSAGKREATRCLVVGLCVGVVAVAAFLPALRGGFVNWDDETNFTGNQDFRGLSWSHLRWAIGTTVMGVYQPLAWVLLEMQHAVWGLDPWGYHFVSVALHAANAIAFFWLCLTLVERGCGDRFAAGTAITLPAAMAALLFAVHPLRTETVAWASCQPYLPCALFYMLSVAAYLRGADLAGAVRRRWWLAAFVLAAAAMLSKAAAVSLPAVLLILDIYPLRRGQGDHAFRRLVLEKLPFLLLAAIIAAASIWAKRNVNSVVPMDVDGAGARLVLAGYSVAFYPGKTLLPLDLRAFYPVTEIIEWWMPRYLIPSILSVALTAIIVMQRRRWPGLLAAWAAYLVILAPNAGLMRAGGQLAADRYSYLATAPLFVALAAALYRLRGRALVAGAAAAGALVVVLAGLSWRQCETWRDPVSLWRQALDHGGQDSAFVHLNLGAALVHAGRHQEALPLFNRTVSLDSKMPEAHYDRAVVLRKSGDTAEAMRAVRMALSLAPGHRGASGLLGMMLLESGKFTEAVRELTLAVQANEHDASALTNLGVALFALDRKQEGVTRMYEAVRAMPGYGTAQANLGLALAGTGQPEEAQKHLHEAIRLEPRNAAAWAHLGHLLLSAGHLPEAKEKFLTALRIQPDLAEAASGLRLLNTPPP